MKYGQWPSPTFPIRFVYYGSWKPFDTMFMIDNRAIYAALWLVFIGFEFEIRWPRRHR